MNRFTYLGSIITKDDDCTKEIRSRMAKGYNIATELKKIWRNHGIAITTKLRLVMTLVWPVAMYGCESWTLRKMEETRINAFETKCLRLFLRVPWTAKKTNEWVLETAGVERTLLKSVKKLKMAYYGHIMRKEEKCLEKEIVQGTIPGSLALVRKTKI